MKLETERLILYPISNAAMEKMVEQETDPDMKQAYSEMLQGCLNNPQDRVWSAVWYMELKNNQGSIVGDFCFKGPVTDGMVEIGYGLREGYCKNGYMTEAVKAAADWALSQEKVLRVEAETEPGNIASQRVLERVGFIATGIYGEEGPRYVLKGRSTKMNVNYEKKPAMTFIGYHTEIRPEEGYQKCPEFWDKEYAAKYARLWQTMKPETEIEKAILENGIGMFAICTEAENGFAYWIAGLYQGGNVPEGLELYSFPAADWAVFTAKGPMPNSLQTLNTAVWQEWFPTEGQKYHADGTATLEVYAPGNPQSPDYECGIWVPIQCI